MSVEKGTGDAAILPQQVHSLPQVTKQPPVSKRTLHSPFQCKHQYLFLETASLKVSLPGQGEVEAKPLGGEGFSWVTANLPRCSSDALQKHCRGLPSSDCAGSSSEMWAEEAQGGQLWTQAPGRALGQQPRRILFHFLRQGSQAQALLGAPEAGWLQSSVPPKGMRRSSQESKKGALRVPSPAP